MKITIYTDRDETGSTYIMAVDLAAAFSVLAHEVSIVTAVGQIGATRPDLLLNFIPKDVITLQRAAGRFFYCGKMVTVFTPGLSIFNTAQIGYMLLSGLDTPIVCHSPVIHASLKEQAKRLLSPSANAALSKNMHLIPYGVGEYTFRKRGPEERSKFIAPFTRAVSDHKRFPVHRQVTNKTALLLAKRGWQMETAFYASSDKLSHVQDQDMSAYVVKPIVLDRKAYAQELQQYAFSISTSDYESFGLYYVELLMSGVAVAFSDYPWVNSLLPSYRWMAKDADLPALVAYMVENYDEVFEDLQSNVYPFLQKNYKIERFAERTLGV